MKKSFKIFIAFAFIAVLAATYRAPVVEAKIQAIKQLIIDLAEGDIPVAAGSLSGMTGDMTVASTGVTTIAALVVTEGKLSAYTADALHANRIARATFDFGVDGGTHNTDYDMGVDLPDNAVITRAWYEVITAFESGGSDAAILGIGLPTDDAQGIAAFASISSGDSGDVWDAGYHEAIQTGTAASFSTKTTDARAFTFSILSSAAGDITAGKLVLFAEYVESD
jgi:hypothetical protein